MLKKISTFKRRHKVAFAIVIGFAVVAYWRGAWGIMDVFLFPNNYGLRCIVSLALGMGLLAATHYIVEEMM